MKALKGISLGLLGFILFLMLIVFGVTYTVHEVALNPKFVSGVINDIDITALVRETMQEQSGEPIPQDIQDAVLDTVNGLEPVMKSSLSVAITDVYDYLGGKTGSFDLKMILGDSVMNPKTVKSFLDNIDISNLANQFLNEQSDTTDATSKALQEAIIATIDKLEPSLKTQLVAISDPVFKYMLQQSSSINLKQTARQTLLSRDFMTALVDNLDIKLLTRDILKDQVAQLPQGITLNDAQIDQILTTLEPVIKTSLKNSADPIADYLIGARQDFSVNVSLQPAMQDIKNVVKQAFLTQPPPEAQGLPPDQVDAAFEVYWVNALSSIPSNFQLDSSMFGANAPVMDELFVSLQNGLDDARQSIAQASDDVQTQLVEVRRYVKIFQLAYWGLIALILLLALGIVLIHRSVKGASLNLGIILLVYGAIFLAGTLIARMFISRAVLEMQLPVESARTLVQHVLSSLTSPLFNFSLFCTIIGVILIVLSIVYPRIRAQQAPPAATPQS